MSNEALAIQKLRQTVLGYLYPCSDWYSGLHRLEAVLIDKTQFALDIITPALETISDFVPVTDAAIRLLMGTAAQESGFGTYVRQLGGGPALGIYQMEPATHDDIWLNFITNRRELAYQISIELDYDMHADRLVYDLRYATIMARLHYYRVPQALPDADDTDGLANYWKSFYNSHLGAGTVDEFHHNYLRYVA
jgi:hypothetical protein